MRDYRELIEQAKKQYNIEIVRFGTAKDLFQKKVKGENFMTPHIVGFGVISAKEAKVFEFAQGEGICGSGTVYGVTVADKGGNRHDLSKCFTELDKAFAYINFLKALQVKKEGE